MSYQSHFRIIPPQTIPNGSRAVATIYPGAICPQKASFGYTLGSSPAVGSITFKSDIILQLGQTVMIQIGQSTFYGITVKGERAESSREGRNTTYSLVDFRDRLHDIHHFAQYNMGDDRGRKWHILPKFWSTQQRTFIVPQQDLTDQEVTEIADDQEGYVDVDDFSAFPPLFKAFTLLRYLANKYFFTFTFSDGAAALLDTVYPVDLDFNTGKRVIECVEEITRQCNLQFTAWGNIHLHITRRGDAETPFEQAIQAGAVNLCELENYTDASLGAELNDKGRRCTVIGGNNKYEYWYPCLYDWNPRWTLDMLSNHGGKRSSLLSLYNVTELDTLSKLPYEWQDRQSFNGKPRNEMTIKDYYEQIPFKVYRVDFGFPLEKSDWAGNISTSFSTQYKFLMWGYQQFLNELADGNPDYFTELTTPLRLRMLYREYVDVGTKHRDPPLPLTKPWSQGNTEEHRWFHHGDWLKYNTLYSFNKNKWFEGIGNSYFNMRSWHYFDSPYPISDHLITDDNRQFLVMATSRSTHTKGITDVDSFKKGEFTFITDGVSLDIHNYVVPHHYKTNQRQAEPLAFDFDEDEPDPHVGKIEFSVPSLQDYDDELLNRERWWAKVIFDEMRFQGRVDNVFTSIPGQPSRDIPVFIGIPDTVFIKLSQDREIYRFTMGHDYGSPRVREIIQSAPDLHRPVVQFIEHPVVRSPQAMFAGDDYLFLSHPNNLFVQEAAQQIAIQSLNHEFITSAGHITFKNTAGFVPSGLIDSVSVSFDSKGGTREVINFTNVRSDERVNRAVKFAYPKGGKPVLGEEELRSRRMREMMREEMKNMQNNISGAKKVVKAQDNTPENVQLAFGSRGLANVKIEEEEFGEDELLAGELIVVKGKTV